MKKTIKLIIIILLMFNILIFFSNKVEAVSPSASISSSVNGDKITVTISFLGPVYGCNLNINAGNLGSETYSSTSNSSKNFTFTANENKTYTISLSGSVTDNNTNEAVAVSASTTATVTSIQDSKIDDNKTTTTNSDSNVGSSTTSTTQTTTATVPTSAIPNNIGDKSSNARLKSLSVSPVDFTGFKPDKNTGYLVTVDYDVTEVKVTAVASDSKATVKTSGNTNLKVGNNTVNVIVVAQDGTTNSYQVVVNRKDKNGNEADIAVASNIDIFLNSLTIDGVELTPTFQKDVYEYDGVLNQDLTKVNIITKTSDDSVEVSILGNENLVRGKNNITILLNSSKSTETKIYKIVLSKEVADQELINIEQQNSVNKQEKKQLIVKIILGVIAALGVILVIIKIKMVIKKKEILPIDFAYFEKEEKVKENNSKEIDPRTKELFKTKNENHQNSEDGKNKENNNN